MILAITTAIAAWAVGIGAMIALLIAIVVVILLLCFLASVEGQRVLCGLLCVGVVIFWLTYGAYRFGLTILGHVR